MTETEMVQELAKLRAENAALQESLKPVLVLGRPKVHVSAEARERFSAYMRATKRSPIGTTEADAKLALASKIMALREANARMRKGQ